MNKLKTALLNHGEKGVAVICVLFGLMALLKASWSTEGRNPNQIVEMTSNAKQTIVQNAWPEPDKELFKDIPDVESMVRDNSKILTRAEDFQIGSYNPTIMRVKEKRTGPQILAPEQPRAVAVVFPMAMPPEEEEDEEGEDGEMTEGEDGEEKSDKELSEEEQLEKLIAEKFGLRSTGATGAEAFGAGGDAASYAATGVDPAEAGMSGGEYSDPSQMGYGGGGEGAYESMSEYGGDLMGAFGSEMMSVEKRISVQAGFSVTMIVDLRKQRDQLRKALHLPSDYRVAQALIQYVDLHVERRRKQGPGIWDEWQKVTSEDLGEILTQSFGIDQDIVSPAVTRNVITMPLPRRGAGEWRPSEVSHPAVENFELSEEERVLMDKFNQRVKETLKIAEEARPAVIEQKGFSQFVQSATDAGSLMAYGQMGGGSGAGYEGAGYEEGGGSNYEETYDYGAFASSMGEKLTAEQKQMLDETKATADHRLLLVRFLDFTVERGFAYQYRVRLEMKNPNYNHPLDELVDPALSVAQTLHSDWSDPTPEQFIPVAHRTYLTGVDGREGTPEKIGMSVYTDTTETGMPVMGNLKSILMGLPVAGEQTIELVDLTKDEVGLRKVGLQTNELLTAANMMPRLSTSDFEVVKDAISANRGRLVPDEVCVVDGDGGLTLRSVGENGKQEKADRMEFAAILKLYDAWKKKENENTFFGGGSGEGEGGYEEGGGYGLGMSSGASSAGGYYGGGGGYGMSSGAGGSGSSGSNKSTRKRRR